MSIYTYSEEEVRRMREHPCILRVNEKIIVYTFEFKKRALEQYAQGVSSREIWRRAGIEFRREDYPRECMKRWRRIVQKKGIRGLDESTGEGATGRPKVKGVTDADRIKRLELHVRYLEAENDFLAQLRAKRAESSSGRRKNSK